MATFFPPWTTDNSLYKNLPFDIDDIQESISKDEFNTLIQMRVIVEKRLRIRRNSNNKDKGQRLVIKRIKEWVYLNDVFLPDEFVDYLNDCDFEVEKRKKQRNQQCNEIRTYVFNPIVRKLDAMYIKRRANKLYPNSVE